jgi:hypothetical protein
VSRNDELMFVVPEAMLVGRVDPTSTIVSSVIKPVLVGPLVKDVDE